MVHVKAYTNYINPTSHFILMNIAITHPGLGSEYQIQEEGLHLEYTLIANYLLVHP